MPSRDQKFHIGDVLSIAANRLVSRDGFLGVQRALSLDERVIDRYDQPKCVWETVLERAD